MPRRELRTSPADRQIARSAPNVTANTKRRSQRPPNAVSRNTTPSVSPPIACANGNPLMLAASVPSQIAPETMLTARLQIAISKSLW